MKRAFAFGDKSIEAAVKRVNDVRGVAIIGAGTMGRGIAADLLSKTDYAVTLLDVDRDALDRAKTDFFHSVSHELRTPLTLILEPLRYLLRGEEPPSLSDLEALWRLRNPISDFALTRRRLRRSLNGLRRGARQLRANTAPRPARHVELTPSSVAREMRPGRSTGPAGSPPTCPDS